MREIRLLHPQGVAFRRRAGAWLVIASLLSLFLTQPFHATTPIAGLGGADAAVVVASGQLPAHGSPHDADLCSMCRASAQTRLGLRVALRVGEVAAHGPALALHLPAPARAKAAPQLREAQPRAPPATLPLLQA
jgi:hypothetical protein